jgi:hypothetical protein
MAYETNDWNGWGPLVEGSDGIVRDQNGKVFAVESEGDFLLTDPDESEFRPVLPRDMHNEQ